MFTLIIKYANGTVYWTDHFNSMDDLNSWLDVEKTRSYWKEEFTTEVIDNTPPAASQDEIDQREAVRTQIQTLKSRIKTLAGQNDLTAAELKEIVIKFFKIMLLQNSLD